MSESFDASETVRGIGQRGPDKQPREFNPKSLYNLKQYRIPENIPVKTNWNYVLIVVLIVIFIAILCVIITKKLSSDIT